MAVKIRLARRGRKKLALYDVVVADARAPRDGRFIEKLGTYNPNTNPANININSDRALDWLMKGAQPTDTVRTMLSYRGVLLRKHLQVGVIKGAITQEQADGKFEDWLKKKEVKIQEKIEKLEKESSEKDNARLEAETKVKEARLITIQQKKAAAVEKLAAEIKEDKGDKTGEEVAEGEVVEIAPESEPAADSSAEKGAEEPTKTKEETQEEPAETPTADVKEVEKAASSEEDHGPETVPEAESTAEEAAAEDEHEVAEEQKEAPAVQESAPAAEEEAPTAAAEAPTAEEQAPTTEAEAPTTEEETATEDTNAETDVEDPTEPDSKKS